MRVIKFRVWDTSTKTMWSPSMPITLKGGVPSVSGNFTLMQFTGLTDKSFNEVDIYEGDILGNSPRGELEAVGQVIFDTDLAQFTIQYTNGGWAELWQHLSEKTNEGREVIGNIYENKDLLK